MNMNIKTNISFSLCLSCMNERYVYNLQEIKKTGEKTHFDLRVRSIYAE